MRFDAPRHAGFLRCGLGVFFFVGCGSKIQAGGSLAGNDSSEASSTGSGVCGSSAGTPSSRPIHFSAGGGIIKTHLTTPGGGEVKQVKHVPPPLGGRNTRKELPVKPKYDLK